MSGFFQSEEVLGINIILQLERLQKGKWNTANTYFKAHEYKLLQSHRLKFRETDGDLRTELKKAAQEMAAAAKNYKQMGPNSRTRKTKQSYPKDS